MCNQSVELALLIHFCRDRHAILSAHCLRAFDGLWRYRNQLQANDTFRRVAKPVHDVFLPAHIYRACAMSRMHCPAIAWRFAAWRISNSTSTISLQHIALAATPICCSCRSDSLIQSRSSNWRAATTCRSPKDFADGAKFQGILRRSGTIRHWFE